MPALVNTVVNFDCAAAGLAPLTWQWNVGDSSVLTTQIETASHTFVAAGPYPVRVLVTDSQGLQTSSQLALDVLEPQELAVSKIAGTAGH